jgi:ATP phosphoribosyltransferase
MQPIWNRPRAFSPVCAPRTTPDGEQQMGGTEAGHTNTSKAAEASTASLRLGLPKGRFLEFSQNVLKDLGCPDVDTRLGSWETTVAGRRVVVKLLKVQDVTRFLQAGKLDLGVSADEWMSELGLELRALVDLAWCITAVVLAVAEGAKPPPPGACVTIATTYPNLTRQYFREHNRACRILSVSGATESLVPDFCDAIVDCVETGRSLRDNGLTVAEVLKYSSVRLFSRSPSDSPAVEEIRRVMERHRRVEVPRALAAFHPSVTADTGGHVSK